MFSVNFVFCKIHKFKNFALELFFCKIHKFKNFALELFFIKKCKCTYCLYFKNVKQIIFGLFIFNLDN